MKTPLKSDKRVLIEKIFSDQHHWLKKAMNAWPDDNNDSKSKVIAATYMKYAFPEMGLAYMPKYFNHLKSIKIQNFIIEHLDET